MPEKRLSSSQRRDPEGNDAFEETIVAVVEHRMDFDALVTWFKARIVRRDPDPQSRARNSPSTAPPKPSPTDSST